MVNCMVKGEELVAGGTVVGRWCTGGLGVLGVVGVVLLRVTSLLGARGLICGCLLLLHINPRI